MRKTAIERMIVYYDENERIPLGVAKLEASQGNLWLNTVIVGRTSPKGTGQELIKHVIRKYRKKFSLLTQFDNMAMFYCALRAGLRLSGTIDYGFIFTNRRIN